AASARGRADAPGPATGAHQGQAMADALSALTNLGYGPSEAASAVAEAQAREPAAAMPALIRAALRLLAPKD
ncbi:Holliday junction branch migration protein RuvA, partial [Paracoccus marcusii]